MAKSLNTSDNLDITTDAATKATGLLIAPGVPARRRRGDVRAVGASIWNALVARREAVALVGLLLGAAFLAFYNLAYNPQPWQDEGSAFSVAKTIATEGVYAMRSSEGYQTFGPIQSVGPTVLLPIALSFKLFGVGLVQGRVIMAAYLLITLALFYWMGKALFGARAAFIATLLLLGSPAVHMLHHGRQGFGEVPALSFFFGAALLWIRAAHARRAWMYSAVGLLLGAAMITKSQYMVMVLATITLLVLLDLFFYRHGHISTLITIGLVAGSCVAIWYVWQRAYFGASIFQENIIKLRLLGSAQVGFDPASTFGALKFLFGSESDHLYYMWGVPALIYTGFQCLQPRRNRIILAALLIFTLLWLAYFTLLIIPWPRYVLTPAAVCALFVGKLWNDLTDGFTLSWAALRQQIRTLRPDKDVLRLMLLMAMTLMIGYSLQSAIRTDVVARSDGSQKTAAYLIDHVGRAAVIETWEHELNILADRQFHFPDLSLLAKTHVAVYRSGPRNYMLGLPYFQQYRPSYLVIGWAARQTGLYNPDFLAQYGRLLTTVGDGERRYEIYKLDLP